MGNVGLNSDVRYRSNCRCRARIEFVAVPVDWQQTSGEI